LDVRHGANELARAGGEADAPAGHRVRFRARVDGQRARLDLRAETGDRHVPPLERERLVALVGHDQELALHGERGDGGQRRRREHGARRIVGAVQDDRLRPRREGRAQPLRVQVEAGSLLGRDGDPHAPSPARRASTMGQASSSDRPARRGSFGGGPPRYLGGYFSASRFSTIGGTMPATDVPKLATSLIRREEMYVYFSWGIKKTVSTVLRSFRFISAIWNSYSKSETARIPRTMQSARSRATRSIRSPSKATIRKLLRSDVASSIISSRSFTEKSGCFDGLATTATMSSSKICRL